MNDLKDLRPVLHLIWLYYIDMKNKLTTFWLALSIITIAIFGCDEDDTIAYYNCDSNEADCSCNHYSDCVFTEYTEQVFFASQCNEYPVICCDNPKVLNRTAAELNEQSYIEFGCTILSETDCGVCPGPPYDFWVECQHNLCVGAKQKIN